MYVTDENLMYQNTLKSIENIKWKKIDEIKKRNKLKIRHFQDSNALKLSTKVTHNLILPCYRII